MKTTVADKIKKWMIFAVGVIVLTAIDQYTKYWATTQLKDQSAMELIPDVLYFRYLENRGAAFGILQGRAVPLLIFTVVLAVIIAIIYSRTPQSGKHVVFSISIIVLFSGAVGNMIDRFMNQYVVDFIYFKPINFPTFNVADCYVCVSVAVIAFMYLFVFKNDEDMDFLKKKSNSDAKEQK